MSKVLRFAQKNYIGMIGKNKIKLIHSLEQKKYRRETGLFVAEGPKLVGDLLSTYECVFIVATEEWFASNNNRVNYLKNKDIEYILVTTDELRRCSLQKSPQEIIAIFRMRDLIVNPIDIVQNNLTIALDGVQDPGNLGTIVRIADWFGIEHIFCSCETADIYNPKTVQATMGAMSRVQVHYFSLSEFLTQLPKDIPIYGTFLDGNNIYEQELSTNGIIVMGNEGKGISNELASHINKRLYIPSFPVYRPTSESLNVAVATAITCAEFRRQFTI